MYIYFKKIFLIALLLFNAASAQTIIDTISKAKAYFNTYISFNPPIYGTTSNGHLYHVGFINHFDVSGKPLPMEVVRIDLNTGTTSYKTIKGTLSSTSALWQWCTDSLGNVYTGLNSNNRRIWKFNFKDSIYAKDLGNGFNASGALAYSMSVGRDNHVYFGSSSGGTYFAEYDPYQDTLKQYSSEINPLQDYVLSIAGDTDYVYAQLGQKDSIELWAVRKSDQQKKILLKAINTTRFKVKIGNDGNIYTYSGNLGTFILKNGAASKISNSYNDIPASSKNIKEANHINVSSGKPSVTGYFDEAQSKFYYSSTTGLKNAIPIVTQKIQNKIRRVFADSYDTANIYFAGDYYGTFSKYNSLEDSVYVLGKTGYNIYSVVQYNDSIFFFGNYPSGALLKYNKNSPWTTATFDTANKKIIDASKANANPHLEGYFKGTPAGFHHLSACTIVDSFLVGAGDVIRIGKTTSIAVYNINTGEMRGYDYKKITGLSFAGLAKYHNTVFLSTNNRYGGIPKIYRYEPLTNTMIDSINLGYTDYGKIYVVDSLLIGIANNRIYKYNIAAKTVVESYTYAANSITDSYMIEDGRIIINTTNTLPASFWRFTKLKYSNYYEANKRLYAISGMNLIRIRKLSND